MKRWEGNIGSCPHVPVVWPQEQTELSGLGFLNVENRVKQLRLKQHLP